MTAKEIAAKILIVINRYDETKEVSTVKSLDYCFYEVFGEDTFLYYPYNMAIKQSQSYMEYWAKEILKT